MLLPIRVAIDIEHLLDYKALISFLRCSSQDESERERERERDGKNLLRTRERDREIERERESMCVVS